MLSNKWTFSLTCLVMVLALGFASAAVAAIGTEPEVNLEVTDVSSANGSQIEAYAAIATAEVAAAAVDTAAEIVALTTTAQTAGEGDAEGDVMFYLKITNEGVASLSIEGANIVPVGTAAADVPTGTTVSTAGLTKEQLHIRDLVITQYDSLGNNLMQTVTAAASIISHRSDAVRDGRNFTVTIDATDVNDSAAFMTAQLPAGVFQHAAPADVRAAHFDADNSLKTNKESGVLRIELVKEEPAAGGPMPVSIVRGADTATRGPDQGGSGVFSQAAVSGPFNVKVTFTEEPNGKIEDIIDVKRGKVTRVIKGTPFYVKPHFSEGNYADAAAVPLTTGRDRRYHSYLLTITPNLTVGDETVEIAIKAFDDMVLPPKRWSTPTNLSLASNRYLLIVPVAQDALTDIFKAAADAKTGNEIFLPEAVIVEPQEYLVVARGANAAESGVVESKAKVADKKTAAQMMYTTVYGVDFPYPGDNLETFFRNGGQIALLHEDNSDNIDADENADTNYQAESKSFTAGDLVISEIMWGIDQHLGDKDDRPQDSQWFELLNTTGETIHIDKNEWTLAFYSSAGSVPPDAIDVVGNVNPYWAVKGSSGATQGARVVRVTKKGVILPPGAAVPSGDEVVSTTTENYPLGTLASMYRAIPMDRMSALDGTLESSWTASAPDGTVNLSGLRYGTPGAHNPAYVAPPPEPTPEPIPPPMAPVATAGDLKITEIMVASNDGRLPQWIEITNKSAGEVSLNGWVLGIDNDPADKDVAITAAGIKLDGVTLDANQSALVVSKTSNRNSGVAARSKGDDNAGSLDANRIVDASAQVKPASMTYSLLSEMAFRISLEPPLPLAGGATDRGDVGGNLGGGWELPMSEGSRSSIIRREMGKTGAEIMGTDAAGWVLASETSFLGAYVGTYYGDKDDDGTPGYDAGGALPVELSKFGAKRDALTGQVVITWETQSELNNAGFFIKRSQQKNGQFVAVNPTMVAGAGTTSEKQTYTYTDTTAQLNIVYYYQIEDVSLDGNRQTLTRAHRLKGHIGAAGKLTTLWGELKEHK